MKEESRKQKKRKSEERKKKGPGKSTLAHHIFESPENRNIFVSNIAITNIETL